MNLAFGQLLTLILTVGIFVYGILAFQQTHDVGTLIGAGAGMCAVWFGYGFAYAIRHDL